MSSRTDMALLADLAEDQYGLVTTAQAAAAGVGHTALSRLAADGVLDRIHHGVYRVRGGAEHRSPQLYAAWLALDPETSGWQREAPRTGVVSHRSAVRYYDLGDLTADVSEFVLPVRRQTRRHDVRLHRGRLADSEWEWVDGLPVTRPPRIIADLLAERHDLGAVGTIAADALNRKLTTEAELRSAFAGGRGDGLRGGARGSAGGDLLRRLLDLAVTGPGGTERSA
jgi:predicted transcriptional regulator of viral defense system